jgi:hypothetical protein
MYTVLYSVHSTSDHWTLKKSLFWIVLFIIPYVLTCHSCVICPPGWHLENIFQTVLLFINSAPCGAILGTECPIIWAKECRKLVFCKGLSIDGGRANIGLKPRRDDSFNKVLSMSLISAGSISLGSTFKLLGLETVYLSHVTLQYILCLLPPPSPLGATVADCNHHGKGNLPHTPLR